MQRDLWPQRWRLWQVRGGYTIQHALVQTCAGASALYGSCALRVCVFVLLIVFAGTVGAESDMVGVTHTHTHTLPHILPEPAKLASAMSFACVL